MDRLRRLQDARNRRAAGENTESETPLMVCTADDLRAPPAPEGVTLQRVDAFSGEPTLRALTDVQRRAFTGAEATDGDVAATEAMLTEGLAVLARVGPAPAGAGMFGAPAHGVAELVGIGVLEPYRRHGIAAAVTAELARLAFRTGAELVTLAPGSADAARIYARAGFVVVDLRE